MAVKADKQAMLRIGLFILFTGLFGCGKDISTTKVGSSSGSGLITNNQYRIQKCGTFNFSSGLTGGSAGYFLTEPSGSRYIILADSSEVQIIMSSLSLPHEICALTNKDLEQGYEGIILRAQKITN